MKKIDWLNHLFNFTAVILGVFLAFYVSDRAEKRKEKQELKIIVESLIEDLKSDQSTYLDYQLPVNRKHAEDIAELLEAILNEELDRINTYMSELLMLDNYSPNSTTYLSSTTTGKLTLIEDLEIKKMLSAYFDVQAAEVQKRGEIQTDFFLDDLLPWLMQNTNLGDMDPKSLVGDQILLNKLVIYQSFITNKIQGYEELVAFGAELIVELEAILADLK